MKERDFHVQCDSIPFVIITVLLQFFLKIICIFRDKFIPLWTYKKY